MRRRRIVIIGLLILLIPGLLFLFAAPRVPVLRVVIVNESGTPIPGATIRPDGIRGSDRGHYSWGEQFSVKPLPVATDHNGAAKIPFPRYIEERVRSIELSFGIDHPDYSPARPFIKVGAPIRSNTPFFHRLAFLSEEFFQSGKTERIVLKSGAALELTARINGQPIAATNFHAQLIPADGVFDGKFVREAALPSTSGQTFAGAIGIPPSLPQIFTANPKPCSATTAKPGAIALLNEPFPPPPVPTAAPSFTTCPRKHPPFPYPIQISFCLSTRATIEPLPTNSSPAKQTIPPSNSNPKAPATAISRSAICYYSTLPRSSIWSNLFTPDRAHVVELNPAE